MCDCPYQIFDFVSLPYLPTLYFTIVLLVWTSHILFIYYYSAKHPAPQILHKSMISDTNSMCFQWFFWLFCELNILHGMEKTLEAKLEAKPIFSRHHEYTRRCVLIWNNWFVVHWSNLWVRFRAIIEKLRKCDVARTDRSNFCWATICPADLCLAVNRQPGYRQWDS